MILKILLMYGTVYTEKGVKSTIDLVRYFLLLLKIKLKLLMKMQLEQFQP